MTLLSTRLEGRRIILTGAGSGIGYAVLERYLNEGARVVAVVRKPEQLEALKNWDTLQIVVGDVAQYSTVEEAISLAVNEWGGLDVFVANAGIWDFYKKIQKLTPAELELGFDQIVATNVKAVLLAAHASYPHLKESQGSFVATGSNSCFRPGGGGPLYALSKYALRGLIAQLSLDFAPEIRVNGVAPGATDTPIKGSTGLKQEQKAMNSDRDRLASFGEHIPLGRVSQPEEHTDLFVLLASATESRYITGTMLVSDGGISSGQ